MQKKLAELDQIVPSAEIVEAEAPNFKPRKSIEKTALRRSKVKELMKMGYAPSHMAIILSKGIKISDSSKVMVPVSEGIIERDIGYIRQELAAVDVNFQEKRVEVIEKLKYLYHQAITEYKDAKGAVRNSFLNTALSVLNKIMDIEGVKSPENIRESLSEETKIETFAEEIHKLGKDDQHTIITTIRKVVRGSKSKTGRKFDIPSKSFGVSTQPGDNEGISRKS